MQTLKLIGAYHYKIKSTGANSGKFGSCDVCKGHVSETFIQQEQREFYSKETGKTELTNSGCIILFGHYDCLIKAQRQ